MAELSKQASDLMARLNIKEPGKSAAVEEQPEKKPTDVSEKDASKETESKTSKEPETNVINSEYEVKVNLADLQADANSPLYSVKSFEELGLSEELLKGLYAMKFQKPSKIQEKALPILIRDPPHNMIAQSQSGTGKTAAFSLTMLTRVDPNVNATQDRKSVV